MANKYKEFAKAAKRRRIKFWTCERKRTFTREEAVEMAEKLKQYAYACPFCHKWHLTKKHA